MLSDDNAKRPRDGAAYDPYAALIRDDRFGAGEPYDRPLSAPDEAARSSPAPYDASLRGDSDGSPNDAVGTLEVRVTCARGALPVAGAHVFVSPSGSGGVCAACETDVSGLSRLFELPTESAADSAIGEPPPCVRYDVEVLAEGFEPASFSAVPVYEGVTSIQCAELIPKIAGGARRG